MRVSLNHPLFLNKGEIMGTEKFKLPNEKVEIRFIKRKRGMAAGKWVTENHVISGGMLDKSFRKLATPVLKNGSIKNVLTDEEKLTLEDIMGVDLSVYKNRDFWSNRYVTLSKEGNSLDLSKPIDYIDYKILLGNADKVAPSLEDVNKKVTYQFVIIKEGDESKLEKSSFNYKKRAFKLYSEIESDRNILRGIVKFINKKSLSADTKLSWLQGEVEKIVDNKPETFVNFVEDSQYKEKILLSQLEDAGVVIQRNKKYTTSDGIELCQEGEIATLGNAINFLGNPLNQELIDVLKVKLEKFDK